MSITYRELQEMVVDMGFEEDSIAEEGEYGRVFRNAINRSLSFISATVYPQIKGYLKNIEEWGYEQENEDGTTQWVLPKARRLTSANYEEMMDKKITVPEVLEPLLSLLVAHYVWIDDDLTKATIYWNEFDDVKNQIISSCTKPMACKIEGGF